MPDGKKSTKLQLNPDGTVTVPLKDRDDVVVEEPSARQIATVTNLFHGAYEALQTIPDLAPEPVLPAEPKPADVGRYQKDLTAYVESLTERGRAATAQRVLVYGNVDESPYLQAWIKALDVLAGESVTPDDLYAWAMNPASSQRMIDHFTAPLGGPDPGAPAADG